jgi:DNA-binding transcriptional ArsR family regulator
VEVSHGNAIAEVFKALGDPVRWSILAQIAVVGELPCADLEQTLPVSKPTISYHVKILQQARLLAVRKEGRNYFYALRHDVLREVQDELSRLAPAPALTAHDDQRSRLVAADDDVVPLTW